MNGYRIFAILFLAAIPALCGCRSVVPQSFPSLLPYVGSGRVKPGNEDTFSAGSHFSNKQSAQMCVATAKELEQGGHIREAIALYEKARAKDPSSVGPSRHLAVLYEKSGDRAKALKEFEAALRETPEDASLLGDYGFSLVKAGHFQRAEEILRKAIEIQPDYSRARNNLAIALAKQGQYQESYETFEGVLGPAAAHANVGVLLADAGRFEESRSEFQQALRIDPSLPQPRAFLAQLEDLQQTDTSAASHHRQSAERPVPPAAVAPPAANLRETL